MHVLWPECFEETLICRIISNNNKNDVWWSYHFIYCLYGCQNNMIVKCFALLSSVYHMNFSGDGGHDSYVVRSPWGFFKFDTLQLALLVLLFYLCKNYGDVYSVGARAKSRARQSLKSAVFIMCAWGEAHCVTSLVWEQGWRPKVSSHWTFQTSDRACQFSFSPIT